MNNICHLYHGVQKRFKLVAEWKESMGKEKNGGGGEDSR